MLTLILEIELRYARSITYIEKLLKSRYARGVNAGERLLRAYESWKETLSIGDFLYFLKLIQCDLKEDIMFSLKGMIQMIGQFRAYSFEEFIIDLIGRELKKLNKSFEVLWNERLPIWRFSFNREYFAAFDVSVIRRVGGEGVVPLIVVEAKVDVDAPRLKTVLFNFTLLKNIYSNVKSVLVYVNWNADRILVDLAEEFLDAVFNFSSEDGVKKFLDFLELNL